MVGLGTRRDFASFAQVPETTIMMAFWKEEFLSNHACAEISIRLIDTGLTSHEFLKIDLFMNSDVIMRLFNDQTDYL